MSTQEIANRLVELCRQGEFAKAIEELFSEDAISVEPEGNPNPKVEGRANILAKGKQYNEMIEEHYGGEVSEPIVSSSHFSIVMSQDVKFKGQERRKEDEICLYEVSDGKIISEQFFYKMS